MRAKFKSYGSIINILGTNERTIKSMTSTHTQVYVNCNTITIIYNTQNRQRAIHMHIFSTVWGKSSSTRLKIVHSGVRGGGGVAGSTMKQLYHLQEAP